MKHTSQKNKFLFYLGNFLILFSVFVIFYIYHPFILLYFSKSPVIDNPDKPLAIYIPKIKAYSRIIADVNPWNAREYKDKLKNGVAHAKGSAIPGEAGTSFLFAHSSDLPWNITAYNTAFFRLGELSKNDEIIIYKNGNKLVYKVVDRKEVWPAEVEYLKKSKYELVLQTCTPPGTSFKRLLVFARYVGK